MKTDLATTVVAAIVGSAIAFFITNMLIGEIGPFSYKTVNSSVSTDLIDPNPEIFNYRALNPTVEVYIGSCVEYDTSGACVEVLAEGDYLDEEVQENF